MSVPERLSHDEFARAFAALRPKLVCLAGAVLGTPHGAEDVVQEAALVALDKLDQFEAGTRLEAWLARIVRLVALNHGRERARARARSGGSAVETLHARERDAAPAARPLALDFDDRLMRALGTLGETARAALLLRTVLELDYREISALLEIPEGTAMSHVFRAREALRRALTEADARERDGGRTT